MQAGKPVDETIGHLTEFMEPGARAARRRLCSARRASPHRLTCPGDTIIDGGNEWYENTERRAAALKEKGLLYMGMGVSGGEEGARNGPSMMPGGDKGAYDRVADVLSKVAAQVDDGPCVTYIGPGARAASAARATRVVLRLF